MVIFVPFPSPTPCPTPRGLLCCDLEGRESPLQKFTFIDSALCVEASPCWQGANAGDSDVMPQRWDFSHPLPPLRGC